MAIGTLVSLFSGAMGLDLGFESQGFCVRLAVDQSQRAIETIQANRPDLPVLHGKIEKLKTEDILGKAGLEVGAITVLSGAPPCEPYSTAGRRNGLNDDRANAVFEFVRVINEAKPRFFVLEEVPGFIRAAKKHISFYDRVSMTPDQIEEDVKLGSAFADIMKEFQGTGYRLTCDPDNPKASILNAADYGVPQNRKRFIMVGSRDQENICLPSPSVDEWVSLRQGLQDLGDPDPEFSAFPASWAHYLRDVRPGGCWRDLPEELQREALGGAYDDPANPRTAGKKGGRTGFLRRLSWEKPSPTLVDRPTTRAGCMAHPHDWRRPLSVKEYARLQGFPDDWQFCGATSAKYRLIGQATPVLLAAAVAKEISACIN